MDSYHYTSYREMNLLKAPDPSPALLVLNKTAGTPLVTIHRDGRVEIAEGYTPDEAARQFWSALGHMNPLRPAVEDLQGKVRFLLDRFVDTPEGSFTFPDGETWSASKT